MRGSLGIISNRIVRHYPPPPTPITNLFVYLIASGPIVLLFTIRTHKNEPVV